MGSFTCVGVAWLSTDLACLGRGDWHGSALLLFSLIHPLEACSLGLPEMQECRCKRVRPLGAEAQNWHVVSSVAFFFFFFLVKADHKASPYSRSREVDPSLQ